MNQKEVRLLAANHRNRRINTALQSLKLIEHHTDGLANGSESAWGGFFESHPISLFILFTPFYSFSFMPPPILFLYPFLLSLSFLYSFYLPCYNNPLTGFLNSFFACGLCSTLWPVIILGHRWAHICPLQNTLPGFLFHPNLSWSLYRVVRSCMIQPSVQLLSSVSSFSFPYQTGNLPM